MSRVSGSTFDALRADFGTNKQAEKEGVWVDVPISHVPEGRKKPRFLLARMAKTNRRWLSRANKIYQQHKSKFDRGMLADQQMEQQSLRSFCESILLDWEGFYNESGQEIPYSPEAGYQLLDDMSELYDFAEETARGRQVFADAETDEIVGESPPTSIGS